jgi:hypothetical protein
MSQAEWGQWSICFPITAAREPTRSPPPSPLRKKENVSRGFVGCGGEG